MALRPLPYLHLALCVMASLSSTFAYSQSEIGNFSWSSFLGKDPAELAQKIGQSASCTTVTPHQFRLGGKLSHVTLANFADWDLPTGAGFVSDIFRSRNIGELSCRFEESAVLRTMTHARTIFSIEITYHRCGKEFSQCSPVEQKLDKFAFESFGKDIAVVPALGSGEISDQEFDSFQRLERLLPQDTIARMRFMRATDCFVPGLNSHRWRCVVGLQYRDGILRTAAFAEISSGMFLNRQVVRYVTRQSFSNLSIENRAADEFKDEVNELVDKLNAANQAANQERERRQLLLDTVR